MSVSPVAAEETFWTIMSMFASAEATTSNSRAAVPGMSGTPMTVILPWLRSCATPEMIGSSMASSSASVSTGVSVTQVPSLFENDERTWSGTL